jgi:hypothetical protein
MKQSLLTCVALCLLLAVPALHAQDRKFGLGVIVGEPTGLSAKLWTSPTNAFDFGLGWSVGGDRISKYDGSYNGGSRAHFHMDYLWHSFDAITSTERFPLYYGIGGRINTGAGYNSSAAVRGVLGLEWLPHNTPMDIFIEVVPSLQLTSSTGFAIDAGLGARYFFE